MVIAGNNLAEKLFGHAVSREYLQRSTAFCELLEDPDLELDIDLAVDMHAAIRGNNAAATRLVNMLVLNSNAGLDQSTIDFYVSKMISNPIFKPHIDRINTIFNDPRYPNFVTGDDRDGPDGGFLSDIRTAAQDCVNEPCNIFEAVSDSIGRSAQAASIRTSENVFDVGPLKGVVTNIINGVDETIFNNIPGIFQKGIIEVTTIAKEAFTETQRVITGKADIPELIARGEAAGSMRNSSAYLTPYTPDLKSFTDSTQAGAAIMSIVSDNLGGCFNKYQHAFRYNPYIDNNSFPELPSIAQVNGKTYVRDSGGLFGNAGITPTTLGDCSAVGSGIPNVPYGGGQPGGSSVNAGDLSPNSTSVSFGKGDIIENDSVWISRPIIMGPKSEIEGYSVFGGFIDREEKIILTDNYTSQSPGGNSDDDLTMNGKVFVQNMNICPSFWVDSGDSAGGTREAGEGKVLSDRPYVINKFSNGYDHNVTEEGMALLQDSTSTKTFDDGVALSRKMIDYLGANAKLKEQGSAWKKAARENKAFAVLRRSGECPKIFKIVDYNTQNMFNVDLTPAAYKVLFGKNPPYRPIKEQNNAFSEGVFSEWKAGQAYHGNEGKIEASIAIGSYEDVKAAVEEEFECGDIEVASENWRDYIRLQSQLLHPLLIGSGGSTTEKESRAIAKLDPKLVDSLINMSKILNRKLSLTSGYRNKAYMDATGQGEDYLPGSQHNVGKAADISLSGINRSALIRAAEEVGISGIGKYNSFIHVDVRGYRARWG